jgi:soluble lytic murein transglycosylase-like protein
MRPCFVLALSLIFPGSSAAVAQADAQRDQVSTEHASLPAPGSRDSICLMIESAARANDLPVDYFARVIWQESRFQADVVGPITRNGQRAQGIAQFMPGTAVERRLLDPFDPIEALPKSAEFLAELRNQFGNLGLAARPTMPGQAGCVTSSRAGVRCRRRPATM